MYRVRRSAFLDRWSRRSPDSGGSQEVRSAMLAVVVAGGQPDPDDRTWASRADRLIAADGGAAWIDTLGRRPQLLVGDLDSVDASLVNRLEAAGVAVERHPVDKDATDTELALDAALRLGADRIVLLGALGGDRLDHELANLLLLTAERFRAPADVRIVRGATLVRALHGGDELLIEAGVGSLLSLLPVSGEAAGITTRGLQFRLEGGVLPPGSTLGVANRVVQAEASVSLERGTLLVMEIEDIREGDDA